MVAIIACMNQKGGVGKSTLARLVAVTAVKSGANVLLADLDSKQSTCLVWHRNRENNKQSPAIDVRSFDSHADAVAAAEIDEKDLLVLDTKGFTDDVSLEIARLANLVILPSGTSEDDRHTSVITLNNLVKYGIEKRKLITVLISGSSEANVEDTFLYFSDAEHELLEAEWAPNLEHPRKKKSLRCIRRTTTYENAHRDGLALSEVTHLGLRRQACVFADAIEKRLTEGLT